MGMLEDKRPDWDTDEFRQDFKILAKAVLDMRDEHKKVITQSQTKPLDEKPQV